MVITGIDVSGYKIAEKILVAEHEDDDDHWRCRPHPADHHHRLRHQRVGETKSPSVKTISRAISNPFYLMYFSGSSESSISVDNSGE